MPPVTILSPYSGRPVMIREQDLGRALRDEQGRVFYVVEDPEHGRYAARTRKGSLKDLQRYREIESNVAQFAGEVELKTAAAHDATGSKRRNPVGLLLVLFILFDLVALGYVYFNHPEWLGLDAKDGQSQEAPALDAEPTEPKPSSQLTPTTTRITSTVVHKPATNTADLTKPGPAAAPLPVSDRMPDGMDDDPQPVYVRAQSVSQKSVSIAEDQQPATEVAASRVEPRVVPITFAAPQSRQSVSDDFRHTASGLRYKITHLTDGVSARAGNYLTVRYTAQTLDGKPLINDATQSFILASGQAIRAFDEGLAGIREGEQLRLLVPRGHSDTGTLPGIDRLPDQPFLLDIQLVSVRPGVTYIIETPGDPDRRPVMPGDTIDLHYLARVEGRDEIIDATVHRGQPMRLTLGNNEVIQGLELGITGMRLGESRQITIPPYLAYGKHSVAGGLIPPHAVLSFRVTLAGIVEKN